MIGPRLIRGKCAEAVSSTMRSLGRGLQILGLAIPPLAMVLQLTEAVSLGQMLTMLVAAVCAFLIGRILEGYFA